MDAKLAELLGQAAALARRRATSDFAPVGKDDLPWSVIEAFDADIRGHVERDRRIEDERDRVLIAAVMVAETRPDDPREEVAAARHDLIAAIDYLEQAVLRFGVVNRRGARLGYGEIGQPVAAKAQ